jgi:arabinogalactan endo-1,4-beta-galactosidase
MLRRLEIVQRQLVFCFRCILACALVLTLLATFTQLVKAQEFMAGADISSLKVLEDHGATYTDNGVPGNAIDILRDHGVNWFRLRLFVNPNSASDPFVVNDLNYTIALAQRVKTAGAKLLLDLHYSDTWADPGHQTKPAAWSSLSFTDLVQRVHDYTRDAISSMNQAGVLPDMVQVGNEISNGMLWNSGYVWTGGTNNTGFNNLASLLNAGISGTKDGAGSSPAPLIMIHHDKGADWTTNSYFYDKLVARNVPFDVIGYSYYPKYDYNSSTGAGGIADLKTDLINTAARYAKPVVLVETGFASRGAQFEPQYEFPVSPTGQQQFLQSLVDTVESVPNSLGRGVFWWYPEARPTSGLTVWQDGRYGLFDENGALLPAASVFEQFLPSQLAGDYNQDGSVDAADYLVWRKTLSSTTDLRANGDNTEASAGIIDQADFDFWRARFGNTRRTLQTTAAVPEPAIIGLLLIAMTMLSLTSRRSRLAHRLSIN